MHTPFQIENFIVGRGNPTAFARLRQAEREIKKRRRGAAELALVLRGIELDLAGLSSRWCFSLRSRLRRDLELDRKRIAHAEALESLAENAEELAQFERLAAQARHELGPLDPGARARLDAEMWVEKLRAMIAIDLLSQGRPSSSTVELLASFPADLRGPILDDMRATIEANVRGHDGKLIAELLESPAPLKSSE